MRLYGSPDQEPADNFFDEVNRHGLPIILVGISLLAASQSALTPFQVSMASFFVLGAITLFSFSSKAAAEYRRHMKSYWYGLGAVEQFFEASLKAPVFVVGVAFLSGIAVGLIQL